jgi:hypothetical protein
MGFLMGVNIFPGYGFGIAKPGGFVPVAISSWQAYVLHELSSIMINAHAC